ncbi:TPA: hypothetical protein R3D77_003961 [Bacillus cereus]|nr:hypothetical protein [Bacillus cereus]HDR4721584.1 hypothetical protein [Bacillus cereus]HDR4925458.1 hypothetical protein [Bacillus cereus]HDR5005343.1 hypothetical protein [Bacillus cereus]HEC4817594.1 hypothetical protein [Bacillus cereus]
MFEEKEHEEQDEIEELKTFTISDYVKLRKEQRKKDQEEFEKKLKVLQEKTDRLKRELGYKDRNQKTSE